MTTTTHRQVPAIQRYKIGYHSDEWGVRSNTPGGIPDPAGSWVLYEDHLAALVEAQQPTHAQAGALESAEFGRFLSDVLTAAGLVTHGKQCKALGERLADMCAKLRHHGIKGGQHGTE